MKTIFISFLTLSILFINSKSKINSSLNDTQVKTSNYNDFLCSVSHASEGMTMEKWLSNIGASGQKKGYALMQNSILEEGDYLLSKNGLYAFVHHNGGGIRVLSYYFHRDTSNSKWQDGSIWYAGTNIPCCSGKKHILIFTENGILQVSCDEHVIWSVDPHICTDGVRRDCSPNRLELTDYGNLQIVSSCGKILWETRSDTGIPDDTTSINGYLTDNSCSEVMRTTDGRIKKGVCSNTILQAFQDTTWCRPNSSINSKCLVLPECSKINCLFPTIFPPEKFCQYVRNCPGCGPDYLCKGEFVFDVSDGLDIIIEKKLKNNSFKSLFKSRVEKGKTILKIDKEISSKDHRISIQYKSFLKGLKICPYYR